MKYYKVVKKNNNFNSNYFLITRKFIYFIKYKRKRKMSANTAHGSNGVLLYAGEYILFYHSRIIFAFPNENKSALLSGDKLGSMYVTTHRIIYHNTQSSGELQSFNAPFTHIYSVKLEQPEYGLHFLHMRVWPQVNGNLSTSTEVKIFFPGEGIVEFAHAVLRLCTSAVDNLCRYTFEQEPNLYVAAGSWHQVSPEAYRAPAGFYSWLPRHPAFEETPPIAVYMLDIPPPYAGIGYPPSYERPIPARVHTPPTACVPQERSPNASEIEIAVSYSDEKLSDRLAAGGNVEENVQNEELPKQNDDMSKLNVGDENNQFKNNGRSGTTEIISEKPKN